MQNQGNKNKTKCKKPLTPQQLIEICRQKFVNILPNTFNKMPKYNEVNSETMPHINNVYNKDQVKLIIRQFSIFLQLTIQNSVLTSDPSIRTSCLRILGKFRNYLSRDLDEFQNLIYNRIKSRLPDYQVDCKQFIHRQLNMRLPPQVSLYQDPLLFYIYTRLAQEQLFCNHSIMMTRQQRIQLLKGHTPFLNPLYIPVIQERLQTKAKFKEYEDRLLQMILVSPQKDIAKLKPIYFPKRPEQQIKNRIKNLCGNGKEITNPIKQMKLNQYLPLRKQQLEVIIQAVHRFGNRWPVISKFYQLRSPEFLEAEFMQCEKLRKKRQKQQIVPSYMNLKDVLSQKITKNKQKPEIIEEEIEEEEEESQSAESLMEIESQDFEPRYKIINNATFMVAEI